MHPTPGAGADESDEPLSLRERIDRLEPPEQGALQTIYLWQLVVGVAFFAVVLPDAPSVVLGELFGGMIAAGTWGAGSGLVLLFLADGSHRRVTWGWPPWRPEPWRGAIWQAGKALLVLGWLAAAGWILARLLGAMAEGL